MHNSGHLQHADAAEGNQRDPLGALLPPDGQHLRHKEQGIAPQPQPEDHSDNLLHTARPPIAKFRARAPLPWRLLLTIPGRRFVSSALSNCSDAKARSRFTIDCVSQSFEIGPVHVGEGQLFLIAGPCVIESESHVRTMAEQIQRVAADLGIPFIFKASYDKANRTSVKSFRGPGLIEGTRILGRLAKDTGLPVLTDVHEPSHCEVAAEAVDVLQIPAFLCRQTDLLVAAGKTGRAVNVKKGQFMAPWDMAHPVEKVRSTGNERVFLTERGASFGYNTLVVDYRSLPMMRRLAPVVFDGTHSVQQPSAANGVSGGQPEFIPLLARAAVAAGIDGLFLEVHDAPANAKSDGANALDLKLLKPLLEKLLAVDAAARD